MLLLSLLACLDAAADPAPAWEYAEINVSDLTCVMIEAEGTAAFPVEVAKGVTLASPALHGARVAPTAYSGPCEGDTDGPDRFDHRPAALTHFGAQGWEVFAAESGERYLAKRRK